MLPAAALRSAAVVVAAIVAAGPAGAPARDGSAREREVIAVEISFDAERGGPGDTVGLRVRLRDREGHAADAPLRLEAEGGTVQRPTRVAPGLYMSRVVLPAVLGPSRSILVTAAAGLGTVSATLPLAPGPAAAVELKASGEVAADGADHPLWIGVLDSHGNPAPEAPHVQARRGEVGETVPLATGGWVVHYRPPRDTRPGEDVLRIAAGRAATSRTLRLRPFVPAVSLQARGGVVFGAGDPAPAFGGDVASWHHLAGIDLGLVLSVTWWTREQRRTVLGPGGEAELASRQAWLPVTLAAATRLPLGAVVATLSAGGGGALVSSRTTTPYQPAILEAAWSPVATAGLELALRNGGSEPFVAAQGSWIGDPRLETLRGQARVLSAYVGYRFHAY